METLNFNTPVRDREGNIVNLDSMSGGGGGGGSHTYTEEEKKIGEWVDGSDVYEKTITYKGGPFGNSPQNITILTGVKNLIEKNVIYSDNELANGTQFCIDGLTGQVNNLHYETRLSVNNEGNVIVYIGGSTGTVNINAVLRYTKL